MKVGIISPIKTLRKYCTTNIQYALPKLLVDSKEYREFYQEQSERGNYLILDTCKVGWKREPEDFSIIGKALTLVHPSLIITPSYMYNLKKTLEVVKDFLHSFTPNAVAGCLEGTSQEEILTCVRELNIPKVTTLAIPSHLYRIQSEVNHNGLTIYLENHLNVEELDSLDGILVTSLPVRLGLQGRFLSDYLPSPLSLTFYEEDKFPEVIKRNIDETVRFYEE